MDFVQHKVLQDVAQCKAVLQQMEAELQSLPAGFLTHRTVRGRCYYYIETRKPKTSKSIPKEQVEETKVIFQRKKFLKENIKQIKCHIQILEKAYPQCKNDISNDSQMHYLTYKGEHVRSKEELIIANELYINQISYEYERPLLLKRLKKPIHPDFTIYTPHKHNVV